MAVTDPISDMLTVIRNGSMVKKETVEFPASKLSGEILRILKDEGYIKNYRLLKDSKQGIFRVYLRYRQDKSPAIKNLRKISKPGLRTYTNKDKVPNVLRGFGIAIISTSKGVMSGKDAKRQKIGGEVLCYVW